ncbi:GPW/gp25 family protein [Eudoraea adriatica]|uniref:GPW/gp25 family protein n=1 Tax=Eudoraea adriatica TaxID=446681 RepID=UPI0003617C73|nr:GPW/gp25 family protein [Eudoraea adriatica]
MSIKYYTLPLNTRMLINRGVHESCSLEQSISHHIHLINTSNFGECAFDETFGCAIWVIDFDNLKTTNSLKSLIQQSLYESLSRHEKRLHSIEVSVRMKQEQISGVMNSVRIKRKLDIRVKAQVIKTNEAFSYVEYFYIGPLSYS